MPLSLRLQIALFTLIRIVLNTAYRMAYPFLAVFARGLGVDLPAVSLVITARSLAGGFGPFLASVSDHQGRKVGMMAGVVIFSLGPILVTLWPSYLAFMAALILTTLGTYTFLPSMQAYLGDRIAYQNRGRALALTELSWSLSFILGVPLVGFLISRWGWKAPFPVLAALSLVALVSLAAVIPSDTPTRENRPNLLRSFRAVLTHPPALAGLAMGLLASSANEVINIVFGVWMEERFLLQIAALGAASAVIGLSELGGEGLSAALVDRMGKPRAIRTGLLLNAASALILPFLGQTPATALVALALFYITFEFTLVSILPLISAILPEARATMMAVNVAAFSLGRAAGALLSAPLYEQGGILACALAAVVLNAAAAWMLGRVHVMES